MTLVKYKSLRIAAVKTRAARENEGTIGDVTDGTVGGGFRGTWTEKKKVK